MTASTTRDRLDRLRRYGAATVHEAQDMIGALDSAIKPLDPAMTVAGPALTVDCRPADNLTIHHAVTLARPGDVLVVDAKAFVEAGPWGDLLSLAAIQAGIAGLVIDGSVRDSAAIIEMDFPVFSRGVSIKGTGKVQPGGVAVPIVCGGVRIAPGDFILGDADGVVAVGARDIDRVLERAAEREREEQRLREEMRAGRTLVELLNLDDKLRDLERP